MTLVEVTISKSFGCGAANHVTLPRPAVSNLAFPDILDYTYCLFTIYI